MFVFLGADHRGFELKAFLKEKLSGQGYQLKDLGNIVRDEQDDYVDFALKVAAEVRRGGPQVRGIVICGSGVGVDVVANKVKGIRSVLGFANDQVFDAREDDDVNVLALAADFIDQAKAEQLVRIFLTTPFSGEERHQRRLQKIAKAEGL